MDNNTTKDFTAEATKLGADQDLVKLYNAGVFNKEPTIADAEKTSGIDFQSPTVDNSYDKAVLDYYNQSQNVDENQIKRDVLKQFQGQIDATKRSYSQLLGEVKQQSAGRLGEDTAMQSRRGLLGSDFGSAQTEKTRNLNYTNEERVRANEAAAISDIMALAQGAAREEIAAKRLAKQTGTENYLNYLSTAEERRNTKLTNLANALLLQNVDPTTLDKTQLSTIAKDIGATEADIINSYLSSKQTQEQADAERLAELQKDSRFTLSEGQREFYRDPVTGEVTQLASVGKTYAPRVSSPTGGFPSGSTPYANDLDAILGATISVIPSKFGQEQFQSQLSRARNDGDKINLIASQVLKNQPSEIKTDFAKQADAVTNIDKAIAAIDKGASTGVLQNAAQYTFNVFGKDFDPELAQINSYITSAIQPYRSSITGAAWGEQEDAEYAALFGSTKYSPPELRGRLVTLKEILKSKSSQGLNTFVNPLGTYDNPFQTGSLEPSQETFIGDDGVEYYIVD